MSYYADNNTVAAADRNASNGYPYSPTAYNNTTYEHVEQSTPTTSMHNLSTVNVPKPSSPSGDSWVKLVIWQFVIALLIIGYAAVSPYTKVEESFNLHAIHDILRFSVMDSSALVKYDHLQFPGVVPRTFIGPLFIAAVTKCFIPVTRRFGLDDLYAVRLAFAVVASLCIVYFTRGVKRALGSDTACTTMYLMAAQFHFIYYLSRPLPNTFASLICLVVFGLFLRRKNLIGLALLTFACVVFRHELFALLIVNMLMHSGFTFKKLGPSVKVVLPTLIASALLSFVIDSYFWGYRVLPEWSVFKYNVIDGKAVNYGVSPWHWYLTNGLLKSCPIAFYFSIIGAVLKVPGWKMILPTAAYLIAFSAFPHKELRFMFPVFPIFSLLSGSFLSNLRVKKPKLSFYLNNLVHVAQFILFASTLVRLYVSTWNYPGGQVGPKLQIAIDTNLAYRIHVDTLTAMTGFTRFTEDLFPNVLFDKRDLLPHEVDNFNLLITADNLNQYYRKVFEIDAFKGFTWYPLEEVLRDARVLKLKLPFHMRIEPAIYCYEVKKPGGEPVVLPNGDNFYNKESSIEKRVENDSKERVAGVNVDRAKTQTTSPEPVSQKYIQNAVDDKVRVELNPTLTDESKKVLDAVLKDNLIVEPSTMTETIMSTTPDIPNHQQVPKEQPVIQPIVEVEKPKEPVMDKVEEPIVEQKENENVKENGKREPVLDIAVAEPAKGVDPKEPLVDKNAVDSNNSNIDPAVVTKDNKREEEKDDVKKGPIHTAKIPESYDSINNDEGDEDDDLFDDEL